MSNALSRGPCYVCHVDAAEHTATSHVWQPFTSTPAGVTANHDTKGRAAKGNNLRGEVKAKRTRGLARFLAQETENGLEMGRVMLEIARDKDHRDRFKAADWVVVRLMGKPADKVEVTGADGKPLDRPLERVAIEDLLALAKAKTEGA